MFFFMGHIFKYDHDDVLSLSLNSGLGLILSASNKAKHLITFAVSSRSFHIGMCTL